MSGTSEISNALTFLLSLFSTQRGLALKRSFLWSCYYRVDSWLSILKLSLFFLKIFIACLRSKGRCGESVIDISTIRICIVELFS
jgi:hypothetical protein